MYIFCLLFVLLVYTSTTYFLREWIVSLRGRNIFLSFIIPMYIRSLISVHFVLQNGTILLKDTVQVMKTRQPHGYLRAQPESCTRATTVTAVDSLSHLGCWMLERRHPLMALVSQLMMKTQKHYREATQFL